MSPIIFALVLFGVLWGGSTWWLLRHTQFSGWVKYVHVVAAFPLLSVLVTLNVVLTGQIAPGLLALVTRLEAEGWSSRLVAPVAFLAAVPLAVVIFYLWIKLLEFLDGGIRLVSNGSNIALERRGGARSVTRSEVSTGQE